MHHLVYTSTAFVPFAENELQQALDHWRANNARLNITGLLLYSDGNILQALEGEAEVVKNLFATIAADVRHRDVAKVADGPVQGRVFADWSMQFRSVDNQEFERFLRRINADSEQAGSLLPLLESFMTQEPWE